MAKDEKIKIGDEGIFTEAKDFDELFQVLRNEEEISGFSGNVYEAEPLILIINEFREELRESQGKTEIKSISEKAIKRLINRDSKLMDLILKVTRNEGLRQKVAELAIKEAIQRGKKTVKK